MAYRSSLLFLALLPACSLYGDDVVDDDAWPGYELPLCETSRTTYRIDAIELPLSSAAAEDLGWDFDGDQWSDNQGGNILSSLTNAITVDLQGAVTEALAADLVQIGVVVDRCADPDYTLVSLVRGLELDRATTPPRMVADDVTSFAAVAIDGGPATDGTSQFPVGQLIHPAADAWIDALELVVDVEAPSDGGLEGRMMAVLPHDQEVEIVTEAFQRKITDRLEELGPEDPLVADILGVFDEDEDGAITLEEVRASALTQTLLRADVDLDEDGDEDGLSIGVGFHAEPVDLYVR